MTVFTHNIRLWAITFWISWFQTLNFRKHKSPIRNRLCRYFSWGRNSTEKYSKLEIHWDNKNLSFPTVEESLRLRTSPSKLPFRYSAELQIQQKIWNWKAESLSFPTVEESASEDITIESYGPFEITPNKKLIKLFKNHKTSTRSFPELQDLDLINGHS